MTDPLTDDDRTAITARADQFRHALARGPVTQWEPFLAGVSGSARRALLVELVLLDLRYSWTRGDRPIVEDYLRRFPELGPADRIPGAIILEEYRCRVKAGEPTGFTHYRDR